jgi:type VI secretion system protein ImpB
MGRDSTQQRLSRVRPPRVHITYDLQVGNAIEKKELPFVVGVLGDFTGDPVAPLPRLKDRKFVDIDPDKFDEVLEGMKPHLAFDVENKLSEDANARQIRVDLHFKSMEDFEPEQVAKRVAPLKELLDLRSRLSDLRGSLQGNEKLDEVLLETAKKLEAKRKNESEKPVTETGADNPEGGSNG